MGNTLRLAVPASPETGVQAKPTKFLIGTVKFSRFFVSHRKQTTATRSNRDKFSSFPRLFFALFPIFHSFAPPCEVEGNLGMTNGEVFQPTPQVMTRTHVHLDAGIDETRQPHYCAGMSLETAKRVLRIESDAIAALADRLDARFERAVELLFNCQGRVVVSGMGKSGLIGRKIAATLASTGTPALFMHAAEALHGDLGMLVADDLLLAISASGETEEHS